MNQVALTLLILFAVLSLFLIAEAIIHRIRLKKIPLRITVTGTRGKTTIVRMLASVLRESGCIVLAKTTGSEAMYILPDGSEQPVPRHGPPNIIEQKRLIKKAVEIKAKCIITEIMSIHPENHRTETRHLIRPHITLISNIRPDHLDVTGSTQHELEAVFENDVMKGALVFRGGDGGGKVEKVQKMERVEPKAPHHFAVFEENLDLVRGVARHLELDEYDTENGIRKVRMDIGAPDIFQLDNEGEPFWFVNAFAANDPISTTLLMERILPTLAKEQPLVTALLSLRSDRAERSEQWMRYIKQHPDRLDQLFLFGKHAPLLHRAFKRSNVKSQILKGTYPGDIINQIQKTSSSPTVCFGIGNIHGLGIGIIEELRTMMENKNPAATFMTNSPNP